VGQDSPGLCLGRSLEEFKKNEVCESFGLFLSDLRMLLIFSVFEVFISFCVWALARDGR